MSARGLWGFAAQPSLTNTPSPRASSVRLPHSPSDRSQDRQTHRTSEVDEDRALRGPTTLSSQDEEGAEEGPSLLESGASEGDFWAILFASPPALETMITLAPDGGSDNALLPQPGSPQLSPTSHLHPHPSRHTAVGRRTHSLSSQPGTTLSGGLGASCPPLNLGFPSIASRPLWIRGLPFWEWAEHRRVGRAALGWPPGAQRRLCPGPRRRAGQAGLSPPVAMPGRAHRASHRGGRGRETL